MESALYDEFYRLEMSHWWFVGRNAILMRLLHRHSSGESPAILDVGCGTGAIVQQLARLGPVIGLDPCAEALAYCRTRVAPRSGLVAGTMSRLPFSDASFEIVTAFDVLEHDPDPQACVREIRRVLKPGGLFFSSVPAYRFMWGDHDVVNHHLRRYARSELRDLVTDAGFEIVRLTHLNSLLFPIAVVFRQLKNLVGRLLRLAPRSDFVGDGSPLVNSLLRRVFEAEGPLLERIDLPFGLTIACIARRAV